MPRPPSFPTANEKTNGRLGERLRELRSTETPYDRVWMLVQIEFGLNPSRSTVERWCKAALAEDEAA